MLTIRTLEHIKLGSKITILNGIYAILFGLYYIIFFRFILSTDFSAIKSVWGFFDKYNPSISWLLIKFSILFGVLIISGGIAIVYFSLYILRKKEKEAWIVLFIIGIIFWSGIFIIELLNKNFYNLSAGFIGWITFIIGMIIPIRYYTTKTYEGF